MNANAPVTIIKRKKVVSGDGHHGGAWKVAYADFVTAMMAFFMLMWLLNATTEQQRKGIADYFTPTIAVSRISGGGDGMFGGVDILSQDTSIRAGNGGLPTQFERDVTMSPAQLAEAGAMQEVQDMLFGRGGESTLSNQALRHVVTRVTDEGLVIEIFDLPDEPLFTQNSAVPTPITTEIAGMLARVFEAVENDVAIRGHVRAQSVLAVDNPVWERSTDRAMQMRRLIEAGGFAPQRMARVTGAADRNPAVSDPTGMRNNRLEIILLRQDRD